MRAQLVFAIFVASFAQAQEAPKPDSLLSAEQMHQIITERIEAVRSNRRLDERKKMAEQLLKDCNEMAFDVENADAMNTNNSCYNGIACFDVTFAEFQLSQCAQYIKQCRTHFVGGVGRGEKPELVITRGSGEAYAFQMLSAMGCKVPKKYLTIREPSSKMPPKKTAKPN